MIRNVKYKRPMESAIGSVSVRELCATHGLKCSGYSGNFMLIDDERFDLRSEVLVVQEADDFVEYGFIVMEEYYSNYEEV